MSEHLLLQLIKYDVFSDWVKVKKMKCTYKPNDYNHLKKVLWRKLVKIERLKIWEGDAGNWWYKVLEE